MNTTELIVKMIFDRWNGAIKNCDTLLNELSDAQLQKEVAPGKNRGTYLLGHLIAVHDDMLILLGMGDKLYPQLFEPFIKSPDKSSGDTTSASDLRAYWTNQTALLKQKFESVPASVWLEAHTAVTADDFIKEPNRNKLNIIITRTTHLTYHTGQLVLLK